MNPFESTVEFLYSRLPMYQRVGSIAFKKDLTNTIELCARLGNPQNRFKSIHIAGTNGKGSSSHMLAAILQSAGYKTGLYTSPHLKSFTERIRVNGIEVSQQFVVDFTGHVKPWIEEIEPSFFELTVAMAFEYFYQQAVDVAVIEVGLGGRLDSTNVIEPELSLITNIGWDHMDMLGDTLPKIAFEKAGIIKKSKPVVISERQPETQSVFQNKAKEQGSAIYFASDDVEVGQTLVSNLFTYDIKGPGLQIENLRPQLQGGYQRKNLAGVVKSAMLLRELGWNIQANDIRNGIEQTVVLTGLKGRWQKLANSPLTICDTAHNLDGVKEVIAQVEAQNFKTLHIVWGSVKDKDISGILALLPRQAKYYFCQAQIPRAMPATELREQATQRGLAGVAIRSVNEALNEARRQADRNDFIFIGGSTFVVAELEEL